MVSGFVRVARRTTHILDGNGNNITPNDAHRDSSSNSHHGGSIDFFESFRRKSSSDHRYQTTTTELFLAPSLSSSSLSSSLSLLRTTSSPTSRSFLPPRSSLTVVFGQKGGSKADKQKKKPKKKAGGSASSGQPSPTAAAAAAPRVSNQTNVPIRRQIRYGKINKQLRELGAGGTTGYRQTKKGNFVATSGPGGIGPVKRSSYRKQLDEETIEQKALERQRKGQNPDWSVILNQTKADPLVLVDGYNVIYKWPRLKKHMGRGDMDRARQLLLDDLEGLASLQRWRIECVFDGAGRALVQGPLGTGPGNSRVDANVGSNPVLAPFGKTGSVRTVYTGRNIEADTYIEGRCLAAKNVTLGKITNSLIVATDDSQIKLMANSAGALCMSSDRFVSELKAVKKGMQYRVEKAMSEINHTPIRPESQWGTSPDAVSATGGVTISNKGTGDYRNKPKREVLEEKTDGSKLVMARYGANELLIKDNRGKAKPKKNAMANGAPSKKKKKKKKKK